jgi:hypothetical protein
MSDPRFSVARHHPRKRVESNATPQAREAKGRERMLYKVTPMLPAEKPARVGRGGARPRRKSSIYDAEGNEVLITLMCLKCRQIKPLAQFGLRKMGDGAIRNQPWCRTCRSAGSSKRRPAAAALLEAGDGLQSELETQTGAVS